MADTCKLCGKPTKESRRIYCSVECAHKDRIKYIKCENCGKIFRPKWRGKGRKFCSQECFHESRKGKIHPNLLDAIRKPRPRGWVENQAKSRSKYAKIPKEKMRELFEDWKKSGQDYVTWVKGKDESIGLGIIRHLKRLFPAEYEAHVEKQLAKSKNYQRGRQFEYRVRDHFKGKGYWVIRSPRSKGPADLVAIKTGEILLIQCRIGHYLSKDEKGKLASLASSIGAKAFYVYRGSATRGYPLIIKELGLDP